MAEHRTLSYETMLEKALRGVVREALALVAEQGLPGEHHFLITFHSGYPGVALPPYLLERYPEEMTIVLQHRFWDLEVGEESFSVTLSFHEQRERLVVPFEAIVSFSDPSVSFGLQFETLAKPGPGRPAAPADSAPERREPSAEAAAEESAEVVALDTFRKK